MTTHGRLTTECTIGTTLEQTFGFFADAANLERLTPSWLRFEIVTPSPIVMGSGTLIDYRLRVHGVPVRWRSRIAEWEPGRRFVDEQVKGPYALWRHEHQFEEVETADGRRGVRMIDDVQYAIGWWLAGRLAHRVFVRRDLERIFAYRRAVISEVLGPLLS